MMTGTEADRAVQLLAAASVAMVEGCNPFSTTWLREHEVTLDEELELADHLALGAELLAWAVTHPTQAQAAIEGAHMASVRDRLLAALDKWHPKGEDRDQ